MGKNYWSRQCQNSGKKSDSQQLGECQIGKNTTENAPLEFKKISVKISNPMLRNSDLPKKCLRKSLSRLVQLSTIEKRQQTLSKEEKLIATVTT